MEIFSYKLFFTDYCYKMKVEILGNVQDGGVPHLGCSCDVCEAAREDANKQKYVGSLMVKENSNEDTVRYLIDVSPDIRFQIKGDYLDGVFLAHGHLGHIGGLPFMGTEGLDANGLSVHCSEEMENFIMKNDPFRLMVDRGQIELRTFTDGDEVDIQGGTIETRKVQHRHVNTDSTSFMIKGGEKKLYYVSDIDEWTEDSIRSVEEADIAIIDGTFWSENEIDRYEEVPHPTIRDSMEKFADIDTEIHFTHLNHTNPALREDSPERKEVEQNGFGVVERGQVFDL